jgi:E3 ubiquitin-protein ligase HUWE1
MKLLIVSDSNEFSYNINPMLKHTKENFSYFNFIGKLIGKALFDNITINICFNKLIYKMILQEEIILDDLLFIDNPLYTSLHNLKESQETCSNLDDLGIYYSVDIEDSNKQLHSFNLIDNGINISVKDIKDYINKRIFFMKGLYEPFIKKIREGLFSMIKKDVIQIFNSDELELIINGRPIIDVDDWYINTTYKEPYMNNIK